MPGHAEIPGPGPRKYPNENTPRATQGSKRIRIKDRENMIASRSRSNRKMKANPWFLKVSDSIKPQFLRMAATNAEKNHSYTKAKELELRKEKKAKIEAEKAAANEILKQEREINEIWISDQQALIERNLEVGFFRRDAEGRIFTINGNEVICRGRDIASDDDASVHTDDMSEKGWESRSETSIIRGEGGEIDF